jgi:hypothetical protein
LLGGAAHALDHPLNLPGRDADAAGVQEVSFGLEIGGFVGPLQTGVDPV